MHHALGVILLFVVGSSQAATLITYYGDNDGFGVGQTVGYISDVATSHQTAGEAALTDFRLISNSFAGVCPDSGYDISSGAPECGPFAPTGSFDAFAVTGHIVSAILTLRTGSFDSQPTLDSPNRIYLDGLLVDPAFIGSFSSVNDNKIETLSYALNSSFFSLLSDGAVSLAGTHLSEASGSGSFQVDFMSLTITTATVPVPAAVYLFGSGLGLLGWFRRRQTA
jgi:hypothetical protein